MSSQKVRFVWRALSWAKFGLKIMSYPIKPISIVNKNCATPFMFGFSMFTWLGFDKKMSTEDELIHTIKHCILFIQREDFEKAEQLLHVALRQAQQIQHELGITYIYDVMANLALEREQFDKAKNLFVNVAQRIMANGVKEDDPKMVHISAKLARISHLQKEYSTAQLGYDWCLEKLKSIISRDPSEDNIKLLALTQDWYGRLFLECNQFEQGLRLLLSALKDMKEVPNLEQEHIMQQLNDIGTVYNRLGNADESINYLQEAIKVGESLKIEDLGTMYVNLGRAYMLKQILDEARKNCGFGLKLGVKTKNYEVKKEAELCLKEIKNMK